MCLRYSGYREHLRRRPLGLLEPQLAGPVLNILHEPCPVDVHDESPERHEMRFCLNLARELRVSKPRCCNSPGHLTAKPFGFCSCSPPLETAGRGRTVSDQRDPAREVPSRVRTPSACEEVRRRKPGTVPAHIVRRIFVVEAPWPPASFHFVDVDERWAIEERRSVCLPRLLPLNIPSSAARAWSRGHVETPQTENGSLVTLESEVMPHQSAIIDNPSISFVR